MEKRKSMAKATLRAYSSNTANDNFYSPAVFFHSRPFVPNGLMSHARLLSVLVLAGMLLTHAPSGLAQSTPPLNFGNNFFVTGDYIVAGAYGMNQAFTTINGNSYTTGTINVPDQYPGITGTTSVPTGAQVVAALLYWQTVEKVGVAPGASGSGQNGFIRPLLYRNSGGPAAPGYAFSGTSVSGTSTVSWSAGGCNGGSGKILRTYRADVSGGLPNDVNGNPTPNGSFEIRLPSTSNNSTPLTLGATLVVIYRIPAGAGMPNVPLNAIVIYDGDYAQSNAQLTMTQSLQGFYDADHSPVSRLTHIVGGGQSNKLQTVYLSSGTNSFVALPSLNDNPLVAFPGHYGMWDNPTWTFDKGADTNPIKEDTAYATTQVVPSTSNQGCVSWGAIIVSTTVKNDKDGILASWKEHQGYCDASVNNGVCSVGDPAWVDLPNPHPGEQDVYLQYDYMCSSISSGSCATGGNDYSFDPRLAVDTEDNLSPPHANAVDKVVAAYAAHNIHLHAIPGSAIKENQANISCGSGLTCEFPNEPGTVGFRFGLENIKNSGIQTQTGIIGCTPGVDFPCDQVFQHGKKDSYHYALFSHGVGVPTWFLFDGTLLSVKQSALNVNQAGTIVTFTTSSPHGIAQILGGQKYATATDTNCPLGRVTVVNALTNPSLNGTFCVLSNPAPTTVTFSINVGGSSMNLIYNKNAEPYLGVANGQVTDMSGFSDVLGQNLVVALGYGDWGPASNPASDGNKWQNKAGTFMHELGHNMGLTHGGTFYKNLGSKDYTASFEVNCKSNVQTNMSYMFQFDLMQVPNTLNAAGKPLMVVDYSEDGSAPTLTESQSSAGPNLLNSMPYANTASFQLPTNASGAPHCDGTPLAPGEQALTYHQFSPTSDFFWSAATGSDINFNGKSTDVMHPHDEWTGTQAEVEVGLSPGLDLQQVSAIGTLSTNGPGGGHLSGGGGGGHLSGGGGGGHLSGGGGGGHLSGGGGAPIEITHKVANSYARPPRTLTITQEDPSPRHIHLSWFAPTFGTVVQYNLYRSDAGGPFNLVSPGPGTQTTYTDTVTCKPGGYQYRVTSVVNNDTPPPAQLESVPSNTVPASGQDPLTGCYVVTNFSSPTSATANTNVPITWTLTDDFYPTGGLVTTQAANTLVAIGPLPNRCKTVGRTTLLLNGIAQSGFGTFTNSGNQFTFTWATKPFCTGSYTFELDLDSGQKTTSPPLVVK
jgi:hypothetical protein